MQPKLNPLMAQFQDQPALIEEGRSAWLEACLAKVEEASAEFAKIEAANDDGFWFSPDDYRSYYRPYKVKDGILHVPVKGVLLNNFPYAMGSWATGYEYIWEAIKRGVDDSDVRGIALVIDSGGGLVSGNFALVDKIYAMRGRKPIQSFASEHAYSAAYSIASVGDTITVARTGGVGSIGVVVVHMEYSQLLTDAGIKTTIIRSKPGKMEGNPYEVLGKEAQERIQARVDEFHKQFVAIVARNRGMSEGAVDATNALTFMAQEAIENGLADAIGTFDDAITAFVATISEGEDEMADNITQAQVDAAVQAAVAAATATAKAEGVTEGKAQGVADERARISTILDSDLAKTRPSAAKMMVNLGISAEQAAIELGKLPEEKPVAVVPNAPTQTAGAPKGMLKAAMAGIDQPGITAEGGDDTTDTSTKSTVLANLRAFGIDGFKAKKE